MLSRLGRSDGRHTKVLAKLLHLVPLFDITLAAQCPSRDENRCGGKGRPSYASPAHKRLRELKIIRTRHAGQAIPAREHQETACGGLAEQLQRALQDGLELDEDHLFARRGCETSRRVSYLFCI